MNHRNVPSVFAAARNCARGFYWVMVYSDSGKPVFKLRRRLSWRVREAMGF